MRFCTSIKLLFAVLTQIVLLSAQTYQGRILGTVTDPSGAVVASATITVTDVAKNISRTLITNRDGEYVAPDLDPGTYAVSAEAPGFKKTESKSVILEVSRDVQVNLRLSPGAVNETVEVSADGTLLDTTDSTLNGVVGNKAINELPLWQFRTQHLPRSGSPGMGLLDCQDLEVQRAGQNAISRRIFQYLESSQFRHLLVE
jgi:hypothetical protein